MHREILIEHLAEAEAHIDVEAHNIAKQREIVTELEASDQDISEAYGTLKNFVRLHAIALADRGRITQELAESEE